MQKFLGFLSSEQTFPVKFNGPDGVHQPLKEKIQATKSKISVCCLQQMGQLGLFSLTFFLIFMDIKEMYF